MYFKEVNSVVFSQKNNKSSGLDNIIAELYKCSIVYQFILR